MTYTLKIKGAPVAAKPAKAPAKKVKTTAPAKAKTPAKAPAKPKPSPVMPVVQERVKTDQIVSSVAAPIKVAVAPCVAHSIAQSIEESFVLCTVQSSVWTGVITDKATSDEVTDRKKASRQAGKFMKSLVDSKTLNAARNAANKARQAVYAQSVPWVGSAYLVRAERMGALSETLDELTSEFNSSVEAFLAEYPALKAAAQARLGDLYSADDFPSVEGLRSKFSLRTAWLPVASADSGHVKILDAAVASLVAESTRKATERAADEAQGVMIERIRSALDGFNDSLRKFETAKAGPVKGEKAKRAVLKTASLKALNSTAEQVDDFMPLIPANKKVDIADVARAMTEVGKADITVLREDPAARDEQKRKLAAIRAKLDVMASRA